MGRVMENMEDVRQIQVLALNAKATLESQDIAEVTDKTKTIKL